MDGRKAYFEISQHVMGYNAINRAKEKSYLKSESDKYCSKLKRFTYETYVLIFDKNMRILSRNN